MMTETGQQAASDWPRKKLDPFLAIVIQHAASGRHPYRHLLHRGTG
jgi:hypothetical protein